MELAVNTFIKKSVATVQQMGSKSRRKFELVFNQEVKFLRIMREFDY